MDAALRRLVRNRAGARCEYCHLHEVDSPFAPLQIEHIIPKKHHGEDLPANLALACFHCNCHKGPNLSGIDPESGQVTRLYHPRTDRWDDHFQRQGALIIAKTDVGRVTIDVLQMNATNRVRLREVLDFEE